MEIRFNVTGAERKGLVAAVSEVVGWEAVYMKAPTFAYTVNNYTIDKNGTFVFDERVDREDVRGLLAGLTERGFTSEDALDAAEPDLAVTAESAQDDDAPVEKIGVGDASGDATPVVDVPHEDESGGFVIEVPLEGFTATALDNLNKLVASKAALITKAIGADALPIERENGRLRFPWFTSYASPEESGAYIQFVHALCEMAKKQKRVTAKEKPADSEKFAFRCFLLRLGFIGDEYAAARKLLLQNLPGDSSFKSGKRKDQTEDAPVTANAADSGAESGGDANADEGEPGADNAATAANTLAEALADAELIHNVNMSFEGGVKDDGGDE